MYLCILLVLDTLVSTNDGLIFIDVYRKPTHTDHYLNYLSHHDQKHKISTATTLTNRSLSLPTPDESKERELNYVTTAGIKWLSEEINFRIGQKT